MKRNLQDKGKCVQKKKTFFIPGTLGRDRGLNFRAVLSNSCGTQKKLQKKKRSCRRRSSRQAECGRGGIFLKDGGGVLEMTRMF